MAPNHPFRSCLVLGLREHWWALQSDEDFLYFGLTFVLLCKETPLRRTQWPQGLAGIISRITVLSSQHSRSHVLPCFVAHPSKLFVCSKDGLAEIVIDALELKAQLRSLGDWRSVR